MELSILELMIGGSAIAFFITVLVVPLSIILAKKTGAIDIPDGKRRIHEKATPRIGGIGIFAGATIGISIPLVLNLYGDGTVLQDYKDVYLGELNFEFSAMEMQILGILIGGTIIFLFGLIDDYKQLPAWPKLIAQIICASIVYYFGVEVEFLSLILDMNLYFSEIASYIFTVFWVVAITNTINLIDGLDGLASGTVAIASLCIAYIGYFSGYYQGALPMMAIAGAALGFLIYNFYPAKTFMGDCGSQYLGFLIGTLSIVGTVKSATVMAVILPGIALSLPIFDTIFAIIRRKIKGQPIMAPDKGHFHHRLIKSGMGQRRTVLCMYGICGILGIAAILFSRGLYLEVIGLLAIAIVYVVVVLTDISGAKIDKILKTK